MLVYNPLSEIKEIYIFPEDISLKVNTIARLEFELAYNDITPQELPPIRTGYEYLKAYSCV